MFPLLSFSPVVRFDMLPFVAALPLEIFFLLLSFSLHLLSTFDSLAAIFAGLLVAFASLSFTFEQIQPNKQRYNPSNLAHSTFNK